MARSFVVVYAAADRPVALALARHFPDEPVNLVEIGHRVLGPDAVTAPASRATDVVVLWSSHCDDSPQLPWLLNPSLMHRLGNVIRVAIWLFRLDHAMPPLDLAAFSMGGGVPDADFIAAKLRGRPPVLPAGERFFGRGEYLRKFDRVFYQRGVGLLWLHGLAGVGKRTLARQQAARYDPSGHWTLRVGLRPGTHDVELDLQVVAGLHAATAALRDVVPVERYDRPETAREVFGQHLKDAFPHIALWIFEDAEHLLGDDQHPNEVLHRLLVDLRDLAGVTDVGRIAILTSTRRPRLPADLVGMSVLEEVRGLDPLDAVNLLRSRGAELVPEEVLARCAVELNGHPLALEIAAPTIAEGQYDWEQTRVRAATEVLAATALSEDARALTEALAVVDGPVGLEQLAAYLDMAEPTFRAALSEAVSYSLVHPSDDGYHELHPLVRGYFLQDFQQRSDRRERASRLGDAVLELLGQQSKGNRLYVRCALTAFRLLGLSLRIQEARDLRANLLGPLFEAGVELYRQQRWQDALANFEAVVSWYEDHLEALLYLVRCQARLGEVAAARQTLARLLERHPDDKQVLRVAGRVEAIAEDWGQAIHYFGQALERGGTYTPLLQDLAQALTRVGRWEEARDALEQIIETSQGDAYTFNQLGEVLERLGAVHEALDYARLACRYNPRNARYLRRLGDLSRRAGHNVQARRAYQQALELQPDDQQVKLALATTLLDLGEPVRSGELLSTVRAETPRSRLEHRLLHARLALAAGQPAEARRLAAEPLGATDDPRLLRSAAELQLALAAAGAIDLATARRRVEHLIARLRRARAIPDVEDLTAHLARLSPPRPGAPPPPLYAPDRDTRDRDGRS